VIHENLVVKNVTVTLDEETALWARLEAARRDISVSSLIRQLLTEHMGGQVAYDGAKGRYLARQAAAMSTPGSSYPGREELHDRAGLR
jgi:anti-sigma factor RsiW